ncbi:putative reverse transcriptase domain-containing protein [Tanacetum coccineum]
MRLIPTTIEGVNQRVTDLATIVKEETTSMYGIMEDAQDDGLGLSMVLADYARSDVIVTGNTVGAQSALIQSFIQQFTGDRGRITDVIGIDHMRTGSVEHMTLRLLKRTTDTDGSSYGGSMDQQKEGQCKLPLTAPTGFLKCQTLELHGALKELLDVTQNNALTWWNSHVKTTTPEAAYAMPWRTLKKMMTDKYCPRGEIKKLEFEMWNLKDAFELPMTHDKDPTSWAERQADNKRKSDDTAKNNQNQQQTGDKTLEELCRRKMVVTASVPKCQHLGLISLGNAKAQAKVYAVGNAGANPDNNVVTDLMPIELGSFDVIIRMDWLAKYHAVIVCAEKIVRIPFGDKILIVCGDGSSNKHGTRLNIIWCAKAQEYLTKGCHVFLANITATKDEDKSKEKRLEDVPVVQEFPEVFPEDLPGIPPTRQVEFRIDLVPGATPVARAPYRLAPSEMKELAEQLLGTYGQGFIDQSFLALGQLRIKDLFGPAALRGSRFIQDSNLEVRVSPVEGSRMKTFTSAPILALPEGSEDFIAYCDASKKGLVLCVLMQREKVISYASRQLKIHEKNYRTHDLELRAIVFALKIWRHYLRIPQCNGFLFTDHKSLQLILDQEGIKQ